MGFFCSDSNIKNFYCHFSTMLVYKQDSFLPVYSSLSFCFCYELSLFSHNLKCNSFCGHSFGFQRLCYLLVGSPSYFKTPKLRHIKAAIILLDIICKMLNIVYLCHNLGDTSVFSDELCLKAQITSRMIA